jgi:hypothetical protein
VRNLEEKGYCEAYTLAGFRKTIPISIITLRTTEKGLWTRQLTIPTVHTKNMVSSVFQRGENIRQRL